VPNAPYYIVIARRKQVLLTLLNACVIVNNKDIYPLSGSKRVIIPVEKDHPSIVVTDGFHITRPLELVYDRPGYFNFEVTCIIDDLALLGGALILAIFYLLGFVTGFLALKVLSFVPVICFLIIYYLKPEKFLRIRRAEKKLM
jgi:hypothetical protein